MASQVTDTKSNDNTKKDKDDDNKLNIDNNNNNKKKTEELQATKIDFKQLSDGSVNNPSYIILIGDSMLDNFYYQMDKKQQSMTSLLRQKYINRALITNLAVEGCESRHVLYGIEPSKLLINERSKYGIDTYPIDHDEGNRVYPLAILEEMISTQSLSFDLPKCYIKPTVILSVGMMDIKTLIPIYDETQIFTQMLSFEKNLLQIIKKLKEFNVNIILLSLWEPHSQFYNLYETPRDAFVMVLNMWMCKLFTIADDHNLAIIDLTRTLNTYDRSHYSDKSIFDNSNKSTMFIVELIDYVFKNYDFSDKGSSVIYYSSRVYGGIKQQKNDITARNNYMFAVKSQSAFKDIVKLKGGGYSGVDDEKKDPNKDENKAVQDKKDINKKGDDEQKNKEEEAVSKEKEKEKENIKSIATHIILMGDSVLDNFYWLKDKTKDVRQQLLDTYDNKIKVTNLAVDESTSDDVLYGMDPSFTYIDARKNNGLDPYPIDENDGDKVNPLLIAKQMIEKKDIKLNVAENEIKPTVVLSVGGNDVRVLLFNFNMQTIMEGLMKFEQNLQLLIEKILFDLNLNLILVLCYEPYKDFVGDYGIQRQQLLQIFNIGATKMFELSETYSLPIIDLSRTFNTYDRSHYGSTSIEPSNKSGQFIVDLIQFINNNFPFKSNTKTSKIYYGIKGDDGKGIVQQENNKAARDGYLQQLLALKPPNDDD